MRQFWPAANGELRTRISLMTAFTEICLKNLGSAESQIAAAKSASWGMTELGTAEGSQRFKSDLFELGVEGTSGTCAMTAELSAISTLSDAENAFQRTLGTSEPQPLDDPDSVYWLIQTDPGMSATRSA